MDANDFLKSIAQQVAPQNAPAAATHPSGGTGPRLQFSVPCFEVEYEQNRAPSLHYIFYDLPFEDLPKRLSFHVVNGWIGGQGKQYHQVISILKPDGQVHLETPRQPLEFQDVNTPFLAINLFPEIPFETEGLYFIVVRLEDQEVLRYPLTVRTVGPRGTKASSESAELASSPASAPSTPTGRGGMPGGSLGGGLIPNL